MIINTLITLGIFAALALVITLMIIWPPLILGIAAAPAFMMVYLFVDEERRGRARRSR